MDFDLLKSINVYIKALAFILASEITTFKAIKSKVNACGNVGFTHLFDRRLW
mgnify:CR=1 FL=1